MKYVVYCLVALLGLAAVDSASAGIFRNRGNVNVNVQRSRGNVVVEKQVVRGGHNARVVEKVVVDNHHHNNQRVVERIVVEQPVYRDVVVEKVVVDHHGHSQRVRTVERVRVR